ncbi:hypothetical protein HELRODRAFT_185685 [Helobdella robusta]|uniref:Uncharacterized protein n=1 Tax=Helobdella robusta TaxID=6412 RepID=T1FN53_HELRO|nr:hypothetical protein HELRODRAFT_185685 [Helobdella robusta]ESO01527.1 hypothetical protein HELRODRAFT_185685 [Helobdella robusta]
MPLTKLFADGWKLVNVFNCQLNETRKFTRLLSVIANKPDRERIKVLGPDRSCAEWLLRNGATVKWKGSTKWQTDYNTLPSADNKKTYHIEEIDVDEAGIMAVGFEHFDGCNHIKRIRLHHCPYLPDEALMLAVDKLKHTLEHLELTSCGDITDSGLLYLQHLSLLRTLLLRDLPEVIEPQNCLKQLSAKLLQCAINFDGVNKYH